MKYKVTEDGWEIPHIEANHLMKGGFPRKENGVQVYGWWSCYYLKGRFSYTFHEACQDAEYLRGRS